MYYSDKIVIPYTYLYRVFKKIEPKWEFVYVGKVTNNITRFGRCDIDMGRTECGEPCWRTHILMPVLMCSLLQAECSCYSVSYGLYLWTPCITHLIWSFLFVMNCLGTVDDGWRVSCLLQVVQEYERAVIFRLGRLMSGGAKGPGTEIHFHATCEVVCFFAAREENFIHILWRIWAVLLDCEFIYWPVLDRIVISI